MLETKMIRRNLLDIYASIVEVVAEKPALISHLVGKSGVNFNNIYKYLEFLIPNKLLEEVDMNYKIYYRITDKGIEYLNCYYSINLIIKNDK